MQSEWASPAFTQLCLGLRWNISSNVDKDLPKCLRGIDDRFERRPTFQDGGVRGPTWARRRGDTSRAPRGTGAGAGQKCGGEQTRQRARIGGKGRERQVKTNLRCFHCKLGPGTKRVQIMCKLHINEKQLFFSILYHAMRNAVLDHCVSYYQYLFLELRNRKRRWNRWCRGSKT